MVLVDIVKRNYMSTNRKAGAAITAGDLVYLSGDNEVTKTANQSCSALAFEGVAMDSVSSGAYLSVAVEPSEVYVNATMSLTAGMYVMPVASGKADQFNATGECICCGRVIVGGTTTSAALIRLMNVPNSSE